MSAVKRKMKIEETKGAADSKKESAAPDIFRYHDYVSYLRDWFAYQKKARKGFSIRRVAMERGIASGYLPMVLSGQRPLSVEGLKKLMPALGLTAGEEQFLEAMHSLGVTSLQDERIESLRIMKRYRAYREHNPNETEAYEYLTKWYYFTIREMSGIHGFKMDPEWVQSQLKVQVPLKEIKEALEFLVKNGYIKVDERGAVVPPEKHINCSGGVYRIALAQYHKQLFQLAEKSIENSDSSEREIKGHTFAIPQDKYDQVRALIDETIGKIQSIVDDSEAEEKDLVYHMEMALFPLTKAKKGGKV